MTIGTIVALTVRPERLRFADMQTRPTEQNCLAATVVEAVFAGERCRYQCHCGDGSSIVLKEPSGATVLRRRPGERINVVWPIADTFIVDV